MKKVLPIIAYVVAIAFMVLVAWGIWNVGRYVSYNLAYEDMVIETVRSQVKPDALR